MTMHELFADSTIDRIITLNTIAKDKFGDSYYSSTLKKVYKSGFDGIVETKDKQMWKVKVREHSPKYTTTSWQRLS